MKPVPNVPRLIEFHKLLNSFAEIERIVHIKRHNEHVLESDSEHAYNLAMMAWFIADYFPELDRNKVICLALVHDLVEIHAGDTYVFADQSHLDSKATREEAARRTLAKDWPDFPALHEAIAEYEERKTPEACFTYALDKIMPMFAIYLNDGFTWHEKQITLKQLDIEKRAKMSVSPEAFPYWEELHAMLKEQPKLFHQKLL